MVNKEFIYEALVEGYKITRARCYASFFCSIGFFLFSWYDGEFSKADGWITIGLLCVAVVLADVGSRKHLIIKKAEKLGYGKN